MKPLSTSAVILSLVVAPFAPSSAAQSEAPEARVLASLTRPSAAFDVIYAHAAKTGTVPVKAGLEGLTAEFAREFPALDQELERRQRR
jgi:hypothetical protein